MHEVLHQHIGKERRKGSSLGAHAIEDTDLGELGMQACKRPPFNRGRTKGGLVFPDRVRFFEPAIQYSGGMPAESFRRLVITEFPQVVGAYPEEVLFR